MQGPDMFIHTSPHLEMHCPGPCVAKGGFIAQEHPMRGPEQINSTDLSSVEQVQASGWEWPFDLGAKSND